LHRGRRLRWRFGWARDVDGGAKFGARRPATKHQDPTGIVVITGMEKAFRTTFTERDYARVRLLGDEYRSRVPRSVSR
jgi:hypothetical protein